MSFIQSLLQILLAFGLLFLLGLGLVLSCFPRNMRSHSLFVAPATGYVAFCFFTIWASGVTDAPLLKTNWWALWGLVGWTVLALVRYRGELSEIVRAAKPLPMLIGVMLLVVFSPVLHQGLDLYIGTANPDFYQSLSFHEALVRFQAKFWVKHTELPLAGPVLQMFPFEFQARFGGVAYSVLLEQLFDVPARTALMTSIIAFLLCLPATVYFFCSVVLEFDRRAAALAAILVAVAAPTTMSFLHIFVGQNSALATFPLAISLIYLALRERSIGLMLLSALILNGMVWIYVMAIPYVLAPFALYSVMKLRNNGLRSLDRHFYFFLVVLVFSWVSHIGVISETKQFLGQLFSLLGMMAQSHYYADFLTEEVFQYAPGLTSYPLSNSILFKSLVNIAYPLLVATGFVLAATYFIAARLWAKASSKDAVFMLTAMVVTYVAVWVLYTFIRPYGYASFKMASWLQFLAAPFFAWYILRNWNVVRERGRVLAKWRSYVVLVLLLPVYMGLNLVSDLDYGLKSYGHDRFYGSLINSYGLAGNKELNDLPVDIKPFVLPGSTIGLSFGDSIENFWTAHYAEMANAKTSIITHEELPDEDSILPDVHTRMYKDSFGRPQIEPLKHFHGGKADYYLLPGKKNWNKDIVDNKINGQPLWENDTFALYKGGDIKDLIKTGRGFFRVEYMDTKKLDWWWPEVFRWTAEGGEIYHLMPSAPGEPYRIQFSAITGMGRVSGIRTIEFWHNDKKFDEVVVDGLARIISRPYFPVQGVNRLVLRIKESTVLLPRRFGLWNRDKPIRYKQISMLMSHISVLHDPMNMAKTFPANELVEAKALFDKVETFNGFDVDGWIRNKGEFTARISPPVGKAVLRILVPGNLGFGFPYKVQFVLNGISVEKSFASPGEYTVDLDLPKPPAAEVLKVEIIPQPAKRIAEGMGQREVLQSIRLSSVIFSTN